MNQNTRKFVPGRFEILPTFQFAESMDMPRVDLVKTLWRTASRLNIPCSSHSLQELSWCLPRLRHKFSKRFFHSSYGHIDLSLPCYASLWLKWHEESTGGTVSSLKLRPMNNRSARLANHQPHRRSFQIPAPYTN